jgi:hypothetical protein
MSNEAAEQRQEPVAANPAPGESINRFASLVARGAIRPKMTAGEVLDRLRQYDIPVDVSPLDILLAEREADER